ncbi:MULTISPECIES: hypothetical protein [Campylobacter]|uniref:Uncharacterized protein n=1 Tax=Campylobacter porcelli TaxID=1660073 RepID=A0A1X9SUD8_9BACT|nr:MULTISPECIES: hypothetical protein [unclassified Campylobacter]ARQ99919.1 hypothetical protein CSUIS_0063 [Campylobacter sp. RM6137]MCR8697007.1 hypothetical protein [Campylobacter sp. RM19073]
MINTGTPRSISGHAVSGGIVAFMVSGAYQYAKFKDGKTTKNQAIQTTLKSTLEGAIIGACAIAAANTIGDPNKSTINKIAQAGAYIAIGGAFAYAAQNLLKPKECKTLQNQQKRINNDK